MEFIEHHLDKTNFLLIKGDLLNTDKIDAACSGVDLVYPAGIAGIVVYGMGLEDVTFGYTGGKRGWKGDCHGCCLRLIS